MTHQKVYFDLKAIFLKYNFKYALRTYIEANNAYTLITDVGQYNIYIYKQEKMQERERKKAGKVTQNPCSDTILKIRQPYSET